MKISVQFCILILSRKKSIYQFYLQKKKEKKMVDNFSMFKIEKNCHSSSSYFDHKIFDTSLPAHHLSMRFLFPLAT